jgi:hypothetical protein
MMSMGMGKTTVEFGSEPILGARNIIGCGRGLVGMNESHFHWCLLSRVDTNMIAFSI